MHVYVPYHAYTHCQLVGLPVEHYLCWQLNSRNGTNSWQRKFSSFSIAPDNSLILVRCINTLIYLFSWFLLQACWNISTSKNWCFSISTDFSMPYRLYSLSLLIIWCKNHFFEENSADGAHTHTWFIDYLLFTCKIGKLHRNFLTEQQ